MYRGPRIIPLLITLLLADRSASAQGIHLRWANCVADGGTRNTTFACDTNAGFRALVASFVLPAPLTQFSSLSGTIDVVAADAVLPAWWNFRDCRSGSLQYNPDAAGAAFCSTLTGVCNSGISSIQPGVPNANMERIDFARVTPANCFIVHPDLSAGTEYVAAVLSVNFNRTLGSPSCLGCDVGVCLTLTRVQVSGTSGSVELTLPAIPPDGNTVIWQGAGHTGGGMCLAATPTRRTVWGAVKALYR